MTRAVRSWHILRRIPEQSPPITARIADEEGAVDDVAHALPLEKKYGPATRPGGSLALAPSASVNTAAHWHLLALAKPRSPFETAG